METTANTAVLKKYNLGKLPEAGSEYAGKYFNTLWEAARKEKINRLGLHQRWIDLHAAYRGQKRRKKYPTVGANYLFKTVESYCATLTEKVPISELTADSADQPLLAKAMDQDNKEWWNDTEQQGSLFASVQNNMIYGTTVEKGVWDSKKDEPAIVLRDTFNIFPCPGYRMCDLDIPYFCDVDFLEPWELRSFFNLDESIAIPTDGDEHVAGTVRETTRGGKVDSDTSRHYQTNYAPSDGPGTDEAMKDKTMVVEIWIRDDSFREEPVMEERPISDDLGRQVTTEQVDTGEVEKRPNYPDGIRKVVICPALMDNHQIKGVLDDTVNPNINWQLLEVRVENLVKNGIPGPATGPDGQPIIDPRTGTPVMVPQPVDPKQAHDLVYDRAEACFPLWGEFPYSATPSRVDTSQWWGFSILEQLEELQGKAELMLTKYLLALERAMFPIFLNITGSGIEDYQLTNEPGLKLTCNAAAAPYVKFLESPAPPPQYLEALQFILYEMDVVSMTPEASEGRRPKGISAAAAIIALQDKAATLFTPQTRNIDKLVRNRGRMWIHFKLNFGTTAKQIIVDGQPINFRGVDVFSNFKFDVESGSSAPITKAGRRQQYVELRKMGDMDRLSMLEYLDIPQAKLINERVAEEQSIPGAIQLLVDAGLPPEVAAQLMQMMQGDQFAPKPTGGTTMPAAEQAGGYSEGINSANSQMSDLRGG